MSLRNQVITIHSAPSTRGFRIIWLCEELKLPYRLSRVDFSAQYRASAEWRKMHPVGKVPVVTISDRFKLFETGAIIQHLLDGHEHGSSLQPPRSASEDYGRYLQWSWFAESTFARATGEIANHKRAFAHAGVIEAVMEEMRGRARACVTALDSELACGKPHICGDQFTAADILLGDALLSFGRNIGEDLPTHASKYKARLMARAAFESAAVADRMD